MSEAENAVLKAAGTKKVLIIEGIRENGTKFRPSDWPERISSTFAGFGRDQRLRYSPGVRPRVCDGQKVLAVEPELQEQNPAVFQAIMKFVRENNLRTREEADNGE
ncbi:DUF3579 domain-containing protein [Kaarinaea lacus]